MVGDFGVVYFDVVDDQVVIGDDLDIFVCGVFAGGVDFWMVVDVVDGQVVVVDIVDVVVICGVVGDFDCVVIGGGSDCCVWFGVGFVGVD